jgi:hypothetical protein
VDGHHDVVVAGELNPYGLSLDASRWEADGLFAASKSYKNETVSGNIGAVWYVD